MSNIHKQIIHKQSQKHSNKNDKVKPYTISYHNCPSKPLKRNIISSPDSNTISERKDYRQKFHEKTPFSTIRTQTLCMLRIMAFLSHCRLWIFNASANISSLLGLSYKTFFFFPKPTFLWSPFFLSYYFAPFFYS